MPGLCYKVWYAWEAGYDRAVEGWSALKVVWRGRWWREALRCCGCLLWAVGMVERNSSSFLLCWKSRLPAYRVANARLHPPGRRTCSLS